MNMFKIPTYEDLEKKENELNIQRKGYTSNLFLKRKLEDPEDDGIIKINKTKEIETAKELVQVEACCSKSLNVEVNDDEDDDEDLLIFIAENKDIIERPIQKKTEIETKKIPTNESVDQETTKKTENLKTTTILPNNPSTSSNNYNTSGSLTVSSKQRGNAVLKHIKNVPWKFCDQLTPDYQMGKKTCGFFLSMKYHLLNPTYIHKRVKEIGRAYEVRVLLCLVDVKEPHHCIKELEKISIFSNLTMIMCWSNEEVARYLETYKAYEFKSAEAIMEKSTISNNSNSNSTVNNSDANFINTLTDFLCQIKSVNKTDASTLRQTFGSVKQLTMASKDELNLCPGLGPLKVNRIYDIFRTPFLNNNAKKI